MKRCMMAAAIPLFAGYLLAQTQQMEHSNTKIHTTTWRGTLVDTGCPSQAERKPSSRSSNRKNMTNSYPVATSTTSYALITEDGRCIPFDLSSNEKVSGLLKINRDWDENTIKTKPTKVEVMGTENNGTISVDDIEIISRVVPETSQ